MGARAYWQRQIRPELVSIPVEIYTATSSSAQIAFHQIHEPSGKRIKYEKVVPGIGAVEPMLTGGKGIHVVVPLTPQAEWPAVKDFAHRLATVLAETEPGRLVATMAKTKRVGRIFINYLRNQHGATAVLPYGVRARDQALVAAPVSWEELDGFEGANVFTIRDAGRLLTRASAGGLKNWGVAERVLPDF